MVFPISNAEVEHGFSAMLRIEINRRSSFAEDNLESLMRITMRKSIDGPPLEQFNPLSAVRQFHDKQIKLKTGETPVELVTHLRDLASKWLQEDRMVAQLCDAITMEQLLAALPEEVVYGSHKPKSSLCRTIFRLVQLPQPQDSISSTQDSIPAT